MKIHADYRPLPNYIEEFGTEKLERIMRIAEKAYAAPCPFCGGEAKLHLSAFPSPGCSIQCVQCHIMTIATHEGALFFPGPREITTIEECLEESLKTWNSRCSKE